MKKIIVFVAVLLFVVSGAVGQIPTPTPTPVPQTPELMIAIKDPLGPDDITEQKWFVEGSIAYASGYFDSNGDRLTRKADVQLYGRAARWTKKGTFYLAANASVETQKLDVSVGMEYRKERNKFIPEYTLINFFKEGYAVHNINFEVNRVFSVESEYSPTIKGFVRSEFYLPQKRSHMKKGVYLVVGAEMEKEITRTLSVKVVPRILIDVNGAYDLESAVIPSASAELIQEVGHLRFAIGAQGYAPTYVNKQLDRRRNGGIVYAKVYF